MSDDKNKKPIVVKRVKKVAGMAHGGAWKIAYADFVTAMMAFFLLMWLLGSTAKGDLKGIADYFNTPLKVALAGGSGSGDSSSVIQGGGEDLTSTTGQVKQGETEAEERKINLQRLKDQFERMEREKLEKLKGELEALIEATPALKAFKNQLLLDVTAEGLRIQIVDEKSRPMFDAASSELKPYTATILREIGNLLNKMPHRLSVSGHTDATPYAGGNKGFGNWELSTNRANASRREMVRGGLEDTRVMRVLGLGSAVLFDKNDPASPINRRISIIVLNKRTEAAILSDGRVEEVETAVEAAALAQEGADASAPVDAPPSP